MPILFYAVSVFSAARKFDGILNFIYNSIDEKILKNIVTNCFLIRLIYESRGDRSSMDFEKLYAVYYMQVYSYVMTLAKNQSTAEEITQNAFVKAMLKEHTYRKGASELTWLCAIAKNLYVDELRKQKRLIPMERCEEPAQDSIIEFNLENSDSAYKIHCILVSLHGCDTHIFISEKRNLMPISSH